MTTANFQTRTTPNLHPAMRCGGLGVVGVPAFRADWKIAKEARTP